MKFTSVAPIFLPKKVRYGSETNHLDRSGAKGQAVAAVHAGVRKGRRAKVYGEGVRRVCGVADCVTVLSQYNPAETCNPHTGYGKPAPIRGRNAKKGMHAPSPTPEQDKVTIWMDGK